MPLTRSTILLVSLAVTPAAASGQIVKNGGFESGNAGWTFAANDCSNPAGNPNAGPSYTGTTTAAGTYARPLSGGYDLWMGAAGCTPSVSQSLTTVAGQTYSLAFWTRVNGALSHVPNQLTVTFNSTTLLSQQLSDTTWRHVAFDVTALGRDQLAFAANNINGGTEIDDVSISRVAVAGEPHTSVLLGTGLIGLIPALRRKSRQVRVQGAPDSVS
jgi:hypothetical protein